MTSEEQRGYTRELARICRKELSELNRPRRERKLRRGLVRPRNQAERDIFCANFRTGEPGHLAAAGHSLARRGFGSGGLTLRYQRPTLTVA